MRNDASLWFLLAAAVAASGCAVPSMTTAIQHRQFGEKKSLRLARDTLASQYVSEWMQRAPFGAAVLSLDATVPDGASVEALIRVRLDNGKISPWFSLGKYGVGSIKSEPWKEVRVEVDVLRVEPPRTATEIQYRLDLERGSASDSPEVRAVTLVTYRREDRKPFCAEPSAAWGKVLPVPQRSQTTEEPRIRGRVCSPTSVAMVLEFYGVNLPTAKICEAVWDGGARIYGNWPWNTAFANCALREKNFESFVARFSSLEELEAEIAAGHPVVIALRWAKGELTDAAVSSSDGHLLVVVGFTGNGDVVVNDPAAHPAKAESVRRIYLRRDVYRCWLENADGIAYVFHPRK